MRKDAPQFRQIQEINYNRILQSTTSRAIRVFLLYYRMYKILLIQLLLMSIFLGSHRHVACEYSRLSFAPATPYETRPHAVAGANERRLYSQANRHVQMQLTKDDLYARRCCGQSTDVFPISCSAATKMVALT